MTEERKAGAPASRLKSLIEALTFTKHMFGISSLDACINSRRCTGVAMRPLDQVLKQAPPLQVVHIRAIHEVLASDEEPWNRCLAGMVLFCIYGRARWSDAQHCRQTLTIQVRHVF